MEKGSIRYKSRGFVYFHFCLYIIIYYLIFWNHKSGLIWLITGSVLIIIGQIIRLWSASYIGTVGRAFNLDVKELSTSGPYAFVRNPIYLGNFIWAIGIAVISELFFLIPYFAVWLIFLYWKIIPGEEKYLEETFGETYRQYCKNVNRIIPKFKKNENSGKGIYKISRGLKNEMHVLIYLTIVIIVVFTVSFIRGGYRFYW